MPSGGVLETPKYRKMHVLLRFFILEDDGDFEPLNSNKRVREDEDGGGGRRGYPGGRR